jgi:hypothetical protein
MLASNESFVGHDSIRLCGAKQETVLGGQCIVWSILLAGYKSDAEQSP